MAAPIWTEGPTTRYQTTTSTIILVSMHREIWYYGQTLTSETQVYRQGEQCGSHTCIVSHAKTTSNLGRYLPKNFKVDKIIVSLLEMKELYV